MPQSIYDPGFAPFGGGSHQTVLHPVVLIAVVLVAVLTFSLPRKYLLFPLVLGLLVIPSGQNLYFGGVHVYIRYLLILVGFARMVASRLMSRDDLLPGGFSMLDKVFLLWATYRAASGVLMFMQTGAIPGAAALLWETMGGYLLFRYLVRTEEDVLRAVKALAIVAMVAGVGMIYEQMTLQNLFGQLGGISSVPMLRNGHARSQGMFQQSLTAGAFGATMFPLFFWLWKRGKSRFLGIAGATAASVMAFTATTSTPILAWLGSILVIFLWPIRKNMRLVRWGIVLALIACQLVMNAPVYFVVAHIDLSGGSTGWDRAMLIDNLIRHFGSWWLVGTHDNVNWGYDSWDSCNQFVSEGIGGGLVCFICFIAMFILCFKQIGIARKAVEGDRKREWLIWLFGAALFAQVLAYFGIDYFDQSKYVWYLLLIMIGVITTASRSALVASDSPHREFAAAEPAQDEFWPALGSVDTWAN